MSTPLSTRCIAPAVDVERFNIYSRLEIIAILRSLIDEGSLVTASFGRNDEFIVTALLAVNPDFEELIFDCGTDEAANRRLLSATQLKLTTQLHHIPIQITASRVETTVYQGSLAFRMRLPSQLARCQRREFYRVKVPLSQPLTCELQLDPQDAGSRRAIHVFDISCGGVALFDYPPAAKFAPGRIYRRCRIELADIGTVTVDLEVVHVVEPTIKNEVRARRCGFRFVNLANTMSALVQRYINRIEREQNALVG